MYLSRRFILYLPKGGLVAAEEVAGVDAGADVVEDGVVAVGDDGVGEGFEAVEVVDDAAAEEG